jgi:hypothetical protein
MWKSGGRAPSLQGLPWHLPYNWGKARKNLSQGKKNLSQSTHYQNTHTLQIPHKHTHITKPTHTHTHTHTHITKQYKTTTVQIKTNTAKDIPKWNSHSIIKCPQYKVTLMYVHSTFILNMTDIIINTHLSLRKVPLLFLSDFNEAWIFSTNFQKIRRCQINENSSNKTTNYMQQ